MELPELVQDTGRITFHRGADGLLHILGKDCGAALDYIGDVVVINFNVMKSADPADDAVGHGNGSHLQTAAELHIWLDTTQQKHISGEPANIHHKGTGVLLDDLSLGYHSGISLRVDQHLTDHQANGSIVKLKLYCPPLKILRKTIPQLIVFWGQSDGQFRFHHRLQGLALP